MRACDIEEGEFYRLKNHRSWYLQPMKVLRAKERENKNNFIVVKCRWMPSKDANIGRIIHVRPRDIVQISEEQRI